MTGIIKTPIAKLLLTFRSGAKSPIMVETNKIKIPTHPVRNIVSPIKTIIIDNDIFL